MIATRKGSLRLFRLFGIDVFLHWSWALIAVVMIYLQMGQNGEVDAYRQPLWVVLQYLALFGIVLMHEFGHALACKSVGGEAHDIVLWPLGGVAYVSPPHRAGAYLWSIVAGPLVNVILLPITIGLVILVRRLMPGSDLQLFVFNIAVINAILLLFNILPVYPLDGGQILRGLLWLIIGAGRSLMVAASIGVVVAGAAVVLTLLQGDYWLMIIALFAANRSWLGIQSAKAIRIMETAPTYPFAHCPRCGKNPPAGQWWRCSCGAPVDPFTGGPMCPFCGRSVEPVFCPHCMEASPLTLWQPAPAPLYSQNAAPPPAHAPFSPYRPPL